jgi:hypothetical protein
VAELRARGDVRLTTLALEVCAGSGVVLFRSSREVALGDEGRATVAFKVPAVRLLGGDYDLALGAAAADEEPVMERTVRFSVVSDSEAEGLVDLGGRWETVTRAEVAR